MFTNNPSCFQILALVIGFIVFGLCIGIFGIVAVIVAVVCSCSMLWYLVGVYRSRGGMS